MHSLKLVAAAALLIAPTVGIAQDDSAKLGQKAKAWMTSNFRSFDCTLVPGPAAAITGGGTVAFVSSGVEGIELAVASGDGGSPTITAFAINTKGTGSSSGRMAPQSCPTSDAFSGGSAPACTVSGDVQSPTVRFTVPLAALGDPATAKNYVGTVTIVKRTSSESLIGMYLSKKGYDYYQVQNNNRSNNGVSANLGLMVLAACDSSKLIAKGGKPLTGTYDVAVAKK